VVEYARDFSPTGSGDVVVIVGSVLITMVKLFVAVALAASVSVNVTAVLPAVVAVPEMTPPVVMVRPAGNVVDVHT